MKEKLKSINMATIVSILKASLIGVIISILLVLLFAFVLKFVDLNSSVIAIVDQVIKIISIVAVIIVLNRSNSDNLLIKSLMAGAVYSIFTFIVFSILNGGINLGMGILTDIVFSALVGGASAIFINIIKKK